jgi:hypothetical protein
MIDQEFSNDQLPPPPQGWPPIIVQIPKKKSTFGRLVLGLFVAAFLGIVVISAISLIGANANAKDAAKLDPSGLPASAPTTSAPVTSAPVIEAPSTVNEDTVDWAISAYPVMMEIADLGQSLSDDPDMDELMSVCIQMGEPGRKLAIGAPDTTAGNEARIISEALVNAADACRDDDIFTATDYLETANDHLESMSAALDIEVGLED